MGHRIELGEIEAALDKLPEIITQLLLYLSGRKESNYMFL